MGLKAEPGFLLPWVARLYCSSSNGIPEAITSIAPVKLLINVITPVGFGSSFSSSTLLDGTHLFKIWLACCWYSRFKVMYTFNPPPPVQEVSSEGQPKIFFLRSSFVFPNTANWGSLSNCLFTSATTCSACESIWTESTIFSGANLADLDCISTINPSFNMIFSTSFLLSITRSGYFLGL